jgi:hypothetical protein
LDEPSLFHQRLLNPDKHLYHLAFIDAMPAPGGAGLSSRGGRDGFYTELDVCYRLTPSEAQRRMRQSHLDFCKLARECKADLLSGAELPKTGDVDEFKLTYAQGARQGQVEIKLRSEEAPLGVQLAKDEAVYRVTARFKEGKKPLK